MLNVRDTIITVKRRCLYLAAALTITEHKQKRLDEAEKNRKKAIPPQRMTQKKAWVREWLTRRPEFRQYDNLLTELHKEDQRNYKFYLRIKHDLFREMSWHGVHWHASYRIVTTSSRPVGAKFTTCSLNFFVTKIFEHFKILFPTWHAVTTDFTLIYALARLESCNACLRIVQVSRQFNFVSKPMI